MLKNGTPPKVRKVIISLYDIMQDTSNWSNVNKIHDLSKAPYTNNHPPPSQNDPQAWAWWVLLINKSPEELKLSLAKPHVRAELISHDVLGFFEATQTPHVFLTIRLKKSLPNLIHTSVNSLQYPWLLRSSPIGCLEDMETNPHLHILLKGKHHKCNTIKCLNSYFKKSNLLINVDFKPSTSSELYLIREAYVKGIKVPDSKKLKVQRDEKYRKDHGLPQYYEWI